MEAEEVYTAITQGSVIVCEGKLRKVFFEPKSCNNGFVDAIPTVNSRTLENGSFEQFTANIGCCRLATIKETKRFNQLKKRSKYLR